MLYIPDDKTAVPGASPSTDTGDTNPTDPFSPAKHGFHLVSPIGIHGPVRKYGYLPPKVSIEDLGGISVLFHMAGAEMAESQPDCKSLEYALKFPLYEAMPDAAIVDLSIEGLQVLTINAEHTHYYHAHLDYSLENEDYCYTSGTSGGKIFQLDQIVLGPPSHLGLPPVYGGEILSGKYLSALLMQGLLESDLYRNIAFDTWQRKGQAKIRGDDIQDDDIQVQSIPPRQIETIAIGIPVFNTSEGLLPYNRVLEIKQ